MELRFTEAERAFRREVRDFLRQSLPPEIHRKLVEGRHLDKADLVRWTRILHGQGWSVPHWPVAWGGTGWDPVRQMIFRDEVQQFPAPEPLSFGASMVGPVIYTFGSEEQKRRFLPRIATLEEWWCQGFSEPGAGSDLAALKTRAVRDGDQWVINGQKAWTTYAQHADWIFVLARTDPSARKQQGISFILVDMRSPGITVRPVQTIDGGVEINEVFFDDVRVPVGNLVGEENKGWDYAKFLLTNERNGQARIGLAKARLRRIRALAGAPCDGGPPRMADPAFRHRLVALEVAVKALEMTQFRVISEEGRNERGKPNPASSILKVQGAELQQATTELLLDVIGPAGLVRHGEAGPEAYEWARGGTTAYFNLRKLSIYGGSNEIQRTIIAKAILGL
ncbi:Pimeloyl-CoA dehydrogenase large subunit [Rhodovastum atsumiense]|uniref:Pimeloyl-CoA dehydrogenase large subunit n=1 Tax=Rhodovastum atsumiense TaxID=504468 RepID=A0A5M6J1Y3_9PROT|nr:acyl-CoA dehydrogenase family protein [Rhodovastum atsumiense]KAA5614087.1 pimeloyl-CoA dehydrogenase large subunit [Rhodovastum atsumiense]CAH2598909.1 Pimeloyl-CoA dehydrogenase large subunit [Rhodovastum atsumiense]